ncbi:DinB family protein [Flavobacterium sp. 83]|uniref:DinB family protein n=1 Tax=Flavobacterium sp. 83 TaxID=1131812 RepID=UPI000556BC33|nr:DinB family protein [Flavobacterium sp. 83]
MPKAFSTVNHKKQKTIWEKLFDKFDMSKEQVLNKCFEHQNHHRAQTMVYLRLVGATPPAEKLF